MQDIYLEFQGIGTSVRGLMFGGSGFGVQGLGFRVFEKETGICG